jgi:hypothetical protein
VTWKRSDDERGTGVRSKLELRPLAAERRLFNGPQEDGGADYQRVNAAVSRKVVFAWSGWLALIICPTLATPLTTALGPTVNRETLLCSPPYSPA